MEHKIDLSEYMARFAELLECDADDLYILLDPAGTNDWLGSQYYNHSCKNGETYIDQRLETEKLGNLPIMRRGMTVFGVTKYMAGDTPYLILATLDPSGYNYQYKYMVYRKGTLLSIIRYHQLMRQNYVKDHLRTPVLEKGLLQRVLDNSIYFLQKHRSLKQFGVRVGRGLLFTGPPGNGKTMLCNYIKGLCGLRNKTYDMVSAAALEDAFANDRLSHVVNGADVLFFDDIDTAYLNRKNGNDGRMACALLSALDGINENRGAVVRIFTTNEDIQSLDEAFTRPGRIDEIISFKLPTPELRREFIHTWHDDVVEAVDTNKLVKVTEGCSFAVLENVKTNLVVHYLKTNEWDLDHVLEKTSLKGDSAPKTIIGFYRPPPEAERRIGYSDD